MLRTKATNKRLRDEIQTNRSRILWLFNNQCQVCSLDVIEMLEIHHLYPLSEGGGNEWDNLTVLCPTCHKAIHIWHENEKGSEIINNKYRKFVGNEQYNKLVNVFRKSIDKNNEYVERNHIFNKEMLSKKVELMKNE